MCSLPQMSTDNICAESSLKAAQVMAQGEAQPAPEATTLNASVNNSGTASPVITPRTGRKKRRRRTDMSHVSRARMLNESAYRDYIKTGDVTTMVSITSPVHTVSPESTDIDEKSHNVVTSVQ